MWFCFLSNVMRFAQQMKHLPYRKKWWKGCHVHHQTIPGPSLWLYLVFVAVFTLFTQTSRAGKIFFIVVCACPTGPQHPLRWTEAVGCPATGSSAYKF